MIASVVNPQKPIPEILLGNKTKRLNGMPDGRYGLKTGDPLALQSLRALLGYKASRGQDDVPKAGELPKALIRMEFFSGISRKRFLHHKKHEFNFLPPMLHIEYESLKVNLGEIGFDGKFPIVRFEGAILDGWNRYRACIELKITPIFEDFQGSREEALELVIRTNTRRNLTPSQWAAMAVDAEELREAIKEKTQNERVRKQREKAASQYSEQKVGSVNELTQAKIENRTDEKIARLFNTNRSYFADAKRIKHQNPSAFEALNNGDKTIPQVKREEKEVSRKESIQSKAKALPKGVYQVIYCDPPWEYKNQGFARSAKSQYPTMPLDKLKKLKIPALADDNSIMFMWATNPMLRDALELLEAWAFDYKTNFVWTKSRHVGGMYVLGKHELLLIGVRGAKMLPTGKMPLSIITGDNNKHSQKPESVYGLIEMMYPNLKYVELFARDTRNGWESWGNEV